MVGARDDPHVERVTRILSELGREHTILDVHTRTDYPRLTLCLGVAGGTALFGDALSLDRVGAVWWRLKPPPVQSHVMPFAEREWLWAMDSLESMCSQACWINPRAVDQRLRNKAFQLRAAAAAGLETPPTLITNDARAVLDFVASCGGTVVYKCLSYFDGGTERALFTTPLSADMVQQRARNIAASPGIYQPLLKKRHELRVTVVGNEIFAVQIDSQSRDDTRIDWRRNPMDVPYRPVHLPTGLIDRLLAFHRGQGLFFGAYDFVVTPDDRYVFLEVNSVGQWLWLEEAAGVAISKALASALHRRVGSGTVAAFP